MSRYRISKVILNHNLKELNATSRFHWISHLITDGYKLSTEYNSNIDFSDNNIIFINKKNITEKIILTIDILISQTTEIVKNNNSKNCKYVKKSFFTNFNETEDNNSSLVTILCDKNSSCNGDKCNFLCKWFTKKNYFLLEELATLKEYLNNLDDNYFATDIEIRLNVVSNTNIPNNFFDYLNDYLENEDK
jgi:hypothetical protein